MERERLNYHLQHAPDDLLSQLMSRIMRKAEVQAIGKPTSQTLLVPVRDPVTGGTFYSGEVLVTSAVVQVNGVNGWAMVMDEQPQLASVIATIDAAWAAGVCREETEELLRLAEKKEQQENGRSNAMVNQTRVSFDLL